MKKDSGIFHPGIIVLMYHRVDDTETDPWNICVSPENFEAQIKFLKKNFNIITARELINQVSSKNIQENSVCITFDDGYADNFIHAKPVLEKYNCAATFFIATDFINKKSFWWDELELIFLQSEKLPGHVCLKINEEKKEYWIEETKLLPHQRLQHKCWKWFESAPTGRCKIFLDLWAKLRCLKPAEIQKHIITLKKWAGFDKNAFASRLPMNKHQLQQLSQHELLTVGLHTHSHIDLQGKEKFLQLEEIVTCQNFLSSQINIETNLLAYPYGSFDENIIKAVKSLNLSACFTTNAEAVTAHADLMKLGRYQVTNLDLQDFRDQLNNWD